MEVLGKKVLNAAETGKRIRELQQKKGLKVSDISEYMGFVVPQAIYKWMRGESMPSLDNLILLSQLFGVTVDEILCLQELNEY